jgi:hypothetical protein
LTPELGRPGHGYPDCGKSMFVFFSNRLGCMGSLIVSAIATLILLLLFGVIEIR